MSSRATIRADAYPQATNFAAGREHVPYPDEHDPVLIRRAQEGDAVAFERLASAYDKTILGFLLALTASQKDALDLCYATLLSAYRGLSGRRTCSMYIWLHRLAVAQWLAWAKKAEPRGDVLALAGTEAASRTVLALQQLSARERLVFTLKACQHLTLRTVAQILDESEETLGRTFTRAVCKLRLAIAESR
jgi:RNA polymerase sigma-70 factor (ECF subfamily)